MAESTYLEAIRQGLFEEMERDPNVFCMGEDIGAYGGAFKVTEGLQARFGEERVIDTPISEAAIVGAAAGAAHMGMRPVCEMQFIDFISCAYDMLTNYVATARYRAFLPCPMVVRGPERRVRAGRPVSLAEPRGGVPPHARAQDRLPGHRERRQGADQVRHPRRGLRALLRAQVSLPPDQGRAASGRSRRADRQGAPGAGRAGPLDHHLRGDRVEGAGGGRAAASGRTGCRSRCWISARCCRWTTRPSRPP